MRPPKQLPQLLFALFALTIGVVGYAVPIWNWSDQHFPQDNASLWLRAVGGSLTMLAVAVLAWPGPRVPHFHHSKEDSSTRPKSINYFLVIAVLMLMMCGATLFMVPLTHAGNVGILLYQAGMTLCCWLAGALVHRRTYRTLQRFTATGARYSEGRVTDDSPVDVDGTPAAVAVLHDFEKQAGSDPDLLRSRVRSTEATFTVETDDGRSIVVDPDQVEWAALIDRRRNQPGSRYQIQHVVPVGARCVLTTGEPAALLAAGPRGRPLPYARQLLARRTWTLRLLLLFAGACVVLALFEGQIN